MSVEVFLAILGIVVAVVGIVIVHIEIGLLKKKNPEYRDVPFYRTMQHAPPREDPSPAQAAILALLPSFGHIYLRRRKRAFAIAIPFFLFVVLLAVPGIIDVLLYPMLILWIWQILDAAMSAKYQTSATITKAAIILVLLTGLVFFIFYVYNSSRLPVEETTREGPTWEELVNKCLDKAAKDGGGVSKYEQRECREHPTNPNV
jgi:hypothetical protein